MKKTLISIFLFLTIFLFSIYSHFFLIKIGNNMINKCLVIEETLNNISLEEEKNSESPVWLDLYNKSTELGDYIYNNYTALSLYLNHERLDIIVSEIARLKEYCANGDLKESLSTLSFIKSYINTVIREEDISIRNIF